MAKKYNIHFGVPQNFTNEFTCQEVRKVEIAALYPGDQERQPRVAEEEILAGAELMQREVNNS